MPWAKTPDALDLDLSVWGHAKVGSHILEALGASPVSEMHSLPLLLRTTQEHGQPRHRGDTVVPLEAMLTAVLAMCGVSTAVLAAVLRCNMTHCNNSEIHGIFSGAMGMGLRTCQCCHFEDSP